MAEGQEQFDEYNGFTIRVLAVPEYSPHPPNRYWHVAECRASEDA
jgi:hypothetical protein